jgi:hypothetical protein
LPKTCFAQDIEVDAASCAASRHHSFDHHRGYRQNPQRLGALGDLYLFHIEYDNFAGGTGGLPDGRDGLFAGWATGAENLDFPLRRHAEISEQITLS